jgi:multiple antibiotic resistance protein
MMPRALACRRPTHLEKAFNGASPFKAAMLEGLIYSAVLLFFIFDPFASLPIFIALTKGQTDQERMRSANNAIITSAILFVVFALVGTLLLDLFSVSVDGFRIAGGIVLLLMAVEIIFGLSFSKGGEKDVAWVIIATPILTGPGVITTAILLVSKFDVVTTLLAGAFALIVTWLLLHNSVYIVRKIGNNAIDVFSRIIGLLLAAVAVEYILTGAIDYVNHHSLVLAGTFW